MEKNLITAYFEADHERLDQLFRQFQISKHGEYQLAKPFFRNFRRGLKRHIIWEEQILFPIFEQKSGIEASLGPTEVMRREHRLIENLLETLHAKVRQADPNSNEEEEELLKVLGDHNAKEEIALYPALDQVVTEEESARIFVAMEEIPEEQWKTCCGTH